MERQLNDEASGVRAWFSEMQACVRAVDYDRARSLFTPDVIGFGTFSGVLVGLDRLVDDQWRRVWPTIRDFTFDLDRLHWGASGDLAWAACPWTSRGWRDDGTTFDRPGRVTVVLRRMAGGWRAHHSHFSLYPPTATKMARRQDGGEEDDRATEDTEHTEND